ncbi:9615_t:CDS:1, partial [Racocetra persica]
HNNSEQKPDPRCVGENTKMSTKDLTKPFYYGSNSESIENFVDDYEGYAAMKDWDETKMRLVVGLHVAEPLRDWVRDIVENNTSWKDVKAAILKSAKSKYDVEMKIERLMNLKLSEDESIVSYTNRFDACAKRVKNEVSNREVKRWYLRGLPAKYREKVKQ